MSDYPPLKWTNKANQLLFDIGYSWSMLLVADDLLREILAADELLYGDLEQRVKEWRKKYKDFSKGRLRYRHEIYDNAVEAAQKGCPETKKGKEK